MAREETKPTTQSTPEPGSRACNSASASRRRPSAQARTRSLRRGAPEEIAAGFTSAGRRDSAYERCCCPGVGNEQAARANSTKTHRMGGRMAHLHGYKKRLKAAPPEGGAYVAESEGFEPPIPLRVLLISNQVPSAARPALQNR